MNTMSPSLSSWLQRRRSQYSLRTLRALTLCVVALVHANIAAAASPIKNCQPDKLNEAGKINIADYKGKVVYFDFWASWCGPCRASFPFMNTLQKDFASDVVIVAVSVDSEKSDTDSFLKETPANFLLGIDSVGTCPQEFNVKGMPSTFIFDRNGALVYSHEGFRKNDPEKLRQKVTEIVGIK